MPMIRGLLHVHTTCFHAGFTYKLILLCLWKVHRQSCLTFSIPELVKCVGDCGLAGVALVPDLAEEQDSGKQEHSCSNTGMC